ncbi:protein translocase subunit SecF [Candidatus Woesearchaeota archaeon]|jgi:preprotein translocase subunit SecF|nr:protein translocase subunit SecF [Candidatus Woesearchaeota archaeon]MBT4114176.1 protein translocase subunit SecF [Candidatus Woesearchaeota archaeon]MBT4248381.1 protein translocase subunit SecF [Candidatus Woesearchaeota archaeon]
MVDWIARIYEKNYKKMLIIPLVIFICCLLILGFWKVNTGEFVSKDVTLTGGLMITVETDQNIDISDAQTQLSDQLGLSSRVKELKSYGGSGKLGYTFEVEKTSDIDEVKEAISEITGLTLTEGSYTLEETSSSLSQSFWNNTVRAIFLAFLFMAIVIFFYFRKLVPSGAIVLAAFSDFVCTLAMINILDIKLSTASVAALLMLIGYSVDSNILLSVRTIKRHEGTVSERISRALKTGMTMTGTTFVVLAVIYLITPSKILQQIALVLAFGLAFDFINTWIQNASILRWWLHKNG